MNKVIIKVKAWISLRVGVLSVGWIWVKIIKKKLASVWLCNAYVENQSKKWALIF